MLITQKVKQKWNAKTKKYYTDLGYKFTTMKDEFEVDVKDLTKGSAIKVKIQCDYCGKEYEKSWRNYLVENQDSYIHKDCCNDCKKYKIQEVTQKRYGVNSVFQLDGIKKKIASTNIEKYGVDNPFAADEIKEKIIETNIAKFGFASPLQSQEIKEKMKATCQRKYGVDYYIMTQIHYGEDNPRWKGGFKAHRIERATADYIHWREGVYAKDLYTCQCCGDKNKAGSGKCVKLNAHHIYNWKDYPEKRYDLNNGITLCESCHQAFHSKYGKKNNTQEQLTDFLNYYGKNLC